MNELYNSTHKPLADADFFFFLHNLFTGAALRAGCAAARLRCTCGLAARLCRRLWPCTCSTTPLAKKVCCARRACSCFALRPRRCHLWLVQLVWVLVALSDPISRCVGRSYAYACLDDAKLRSAGSQEGLPWRKSHQEAVTNGRSSGTWFCRHSLL